METAGTETLAIAEVDDEAVIAMRARRDPEAFAPLYARYVDPVYRYCYRRLGSREVAEDATSAVFQKALTALSGYRGGSFRAWLFTIAHNVVTDIYRERRPTQPFDEARHDPIDPDRTPEEHAMAADDLRTIEAVLARVAPDQRRVLELRLAGLTGREIAEVLGRSEAAVKMLQSRAHARLRVLLGAEDGAHAP